MTNEEFKNAVVNAHPNTEQMHNLTLTDNVVTFDWVEMHSHSIEVTLMKNGAVIEVNDDETIVFGSVDAYVDHIEGLFAC